jgi:hypothetical protein
MNEILNKISEYTKTVFVVNWASATIIFGALSYSIFMYNQNSGLRNKNESLSEKVTLLEERDEEQDNLIKTLTITFSSVETTIEAIRKSPPSLYDEKINNLWREVNKYHNNNVGNHVQPVFRSNNPHLPNQ